MTFALLLSAFALGFALGPLFVKNEIGIVKKVKDPRTNPNLDKIKELVETDLGPLGFTDSMWRDARKLGDLLGKK